MLGSNAGDYSYIISYNLCQAQHCNYATFLDWGLVRTCISHKSLISSSDSTVISDMYRTIAWHIPTRFAFCDITPQTDGTILVAMIGLQSDLWSVFVGNGITSSSDSTITSHRSLLWYPHSLVLFDVATRKLYRRSVGLYQNNNNNSVTIYSICLWLASLTQPYIISTCSNHYTTSHH